MRHTHLALAVLALVLGCKTITNEQRAAISVPAGLNANDVQTAILYDLANQNLPTDLQPGEQIADNAMKAIFLYRYQSASGRKPGWYPEAVEPGIVFAGFEKGSHYLRVAVEYTDSAVQIRLIESRNLSQSDNRIHKAAITWIDQLEIRIGRALGQMAAIRALAGRDSD